MYIEKRGADFRLCNFRARIQLTVDTVVSKCDFGTKDFLVYNTVTTVNFATRCHICLSQRPFLIPVLQKFCPSLKMYPVVVSCVGINSKGPQLQPCLFTCTNIHCQLSSVFNIEICVVLHCYRVSLKHFTVLYVQLRGFTEAYIIESLYFPRTHGFSCFV